MTNYQLYYGLKVIMMIPLLIAEYGLMFLIVIGLILSIAEEDDNG